MITLMTVTLPATDEHEDLTLTVYKTEDAQYMFEPLGQDIRDLNGPFTSLPECVAALLSYTGLDQK